MRQSSLSPTASGSYTVERRTAGLSEDPLRAKPSKASAPPPISSKLPGSGTNCTSDPPPSVAKNRMSRLLGLRRFRKADVRDLGAIRRKERKIEKQLGKLQGQLDGLRSAAKALGNSASKEVTRASLAS
jgi:hypothetical protein